jgi:hypothetical protein
VCGFGRMPGEKTTAGSSRENTRLVHVPVAHVALHTMNVAETPFLFNGRELSPPSANFSPSPLFLFSATPSTAFLSKK